MSNRLLSVFMLLLGVLPAIHTQAPARYHNAGLSIVPTYFSFGIDNGPGGTQALNAMRQNNGTAWDYRYQYITGGINTGHNWTTWSPIPGDYAPDSMRGDRANNYRTLFVYYQLLPAQGPTGNGSGDTALIRLDNAGFMNAYYQDWTLLMRKVGQDGGSVTIIIEPDIWGYIEQRANQNGSNNAADIAASVASSGDADLQGLPNTAQGFAWAMLHIRDLYAPHALLALHASSWGTLNDVTSSNNSQLDATAIGDKEGQFLLTLGLANTPSGISTFDLLSNDIADHDSGQSGIWMDRYNQTYPNFARYLQFIHAMSQTTNRRVILWQVPAGNQYFDTENNSPGHTQDNKAEYILGHIPDFAAAGIISVLFAAPNGQSSPYDLQGDGITNPAPIQSYECNMCNTHASTYPDDDGGYLRLFIGQYYRNGTYPLNGSLLPPSSKGYTPPGQNGTSSSSATTAPKLAPTPTIDKGITASGVGAFGTNDLSSSQHASWWETYWRWILGIIVVVGGVAIEGRRRQLRTRQAPTIVNHIRIASGEFPSRADTSQHLPPRHLSNIP